MQAVLTLISTMAAAEGVARPVCTQTSGFQRILDGSGDLKTPVLPVPHAYDAAEDMDDPTDDHPDNAAMVLSSDFCQHPRQSVANCADQGQPASRLSMAAVALQSELSTAGESLMVPSADFADPEDAVPTEKSDPANRSAILARPVHTPTDREQEVVDAARNQENDPRQAQNVNAAPQIKPSLSGGLGQFPVSETERVKIAESAMKGGSIAQQRAENLIAGAAAGMAAVDKQISSSEGRLSKQPATTMDGSYLRNHPGERPSVSAPPSLILADGPPALRFGGDDRSMSGQVTIGADLAFGAVVERSAVGSVTQSGPDTARSITQQIVVGITSQPDKATEISLNPAELGRVRMQLTAQDGVLTLQIMAERPDTTDLLRRHIDLLAQELRAIGFHDLSFSFSGEGRHKPKADQQAVLTDNPSNPSVVSGTPVANKITSKGTLDLRL